MQDEVLQKSVNDMEQQLALLGSVASPGPHAVVALTAAWARVVKALDLTPPPELRACPHCGHDGMLLATRCGYCWRELKPAA